MDVRKLIGVIAKRHHVLLESTDPIFLAVTLNEIVLAEYISRVQATLDASNAATAAACRNQVKSAERVAERLLTESATVVSTQVRDVGASLQRELEQLVGASVEAIGASLDRAERYRRLTQWSATVAVGCALFTVCVALVLWLRIFQS